MQKRTTPNFAVLKNIDPKNKAQRDYWMRRWGVSATQLRTALRNTNSTEVKIVEHYLRESGSL